MTTTFTKFPFSLIILALLAGLLIPTLQIANDTISTHALEKHAEKAIAAQACKENPESILFKNPLTERIGITCLVNGKWGIVILDKFGREVTSFIKDRARTFEQVAHYMKNAGYEIIH